ncbi:DUF1771-domain-containing protein [Linnemannia elongata AG-77]|uniref:DUF1771-domain-containing protein n=1 Tax=Linnemannia elongata AG-77 TaxID=1314771 RepID=A0A197KAA9_9FUNG|nr:DUF1771-domain-containing protein [Linnemannia elongata AG-77]
MATWLSNFLGSLGLGPDFEPYITGVLYDQNLSEEDKSATIYECLEESCDLVNVNLQDAVAELFAQYSRGGLFWLEAPMYAYPTSTLDIQYPTTTSVGSSRAIAIVRPADEFEPSDSSASTTGGQASQVGPEGWARIDDDEDLLAQGPITVNGQFIGAPRDALDPFDDDEFNPFAPPSASDAEVINEVRSISYPPPIFYSSEGDPTNDETTSQMDLDQDMSPLEMLQLIIGDFSPEKIENAFMKTAYDFENTLELLMAERNKQPAPLVPASTGDIRSTLTCRHFLQGNCFRRDCWFSHDLDSMICKFWLKNQCLKGDTCEFNHHLETSRSFDVPAPAPKQLPPAMDDFDFPSLAASTSTKSKSSGWGPKSNGSKDSKKSSKVSNDTNHKAKNGTNGASGDKDTVDELATALDEKVKVTSPPLLSKPLISYSATAAAAASKPLMHMQKSATQSRNVEEERRSFRLQKAPDCVPWLESGSVLKETYLKARAQAIVYAKARNNCFEMAKAAYIRNDGKAAAKYSSQGREYNDLMMATHREASREIFESRNGGMVKSVTQGETWIDLHGLHVDESLAFLDEFMEKLEKEAYTGTVYIVTGTGNHSANLRAKLKPAIIDWLESWGYNWKEMTMDKVNGGLLAVQVIKGKA